MRVKKFVNTYMDSPLGLIAIRGTAYYITSVLFVDKEGESASLLPDVLYQCRKELQEYFDGKRRTFTVKVKPEGSEFQQKVWKELQKIKYGDTVSYGRIAKAIKEVNGARAVGVANSQNPVAIIIPCHRVIGENGKLVGYAGGMHRKSWLLNHEGNVSGKNMTLF